jgi:6-phosphogluconolactonase
MRSLLLIPLILFFYQCQRTETPEKIRFYVGTSDRELQKSIILCELDLANGHISKLDSFGGSVSPSYLALSPGRLYLYAVNEAMDDSVPGSQQVTGFAVDRKTGGLTLINSQPSEGMGPCHLSVHPSGKYLLTANYGSGTITVHPINRDGRLSPACDIKQHEGSGPDTTRQEKAHAHFICADPGGNYIFAVDLGIDKVMIYKFDQETGQLNPNPDQQFLSTIPGAGPRHLVIHPSGVSVYVVNELNGTLISCRYDPEHGIIEPVNTLKNLEEECTGINYPAAVRVHPGGGFVYASNRGDHSSITVFKLIESGSIERVQVQDQGIDWPRDFNIDPSGKFLLVANQRGNSIVVFRIDRSSGRLEPAGQVLNISKPTSIVFL